jgi:uncharacterized protein
MLSALLVRTLEQVTATLVAVWPYLLLSAALAAALEVLVDARRVGAFLARHRRSGIVAATGAAVATPLCSCGTTAVVLGLMAGMVPWGPVVAFMVASPLTSPQELVYSAALFGWPFAIAFFAASILLGLTGGAVASTAERRGWLAGQARVAPVAAGGDRARDAGVPVPAAAGARAYIFLAALGRSLRRLGLFFLAFTFVGYALNNLIPESWVRTLFGGGAIWGVPLSATLGIPFYFNTEASLPLVRPLLDAGMSPGAALAFLITGAGTSVGAVAGALTIARWRVVGLVVGTLWAGAVALGLAYDALRAAQWISG